MPPAPFGEALGGTRLASLSNTTCTQYCHHRIQTHLSWSELEALGLATVGSRIGSECRPPTRETAGGLVSRSQAKAASAGRRLWKPQLVWSAGASHVHISSDRPVSPSAPLSDELCGAQHCFVRLFALVALPAMFVHRNASSAASVASGEGCSDAASFFMHGGASMVLEERIGLAAQVGDRPIPSASEGCKWCRRWWTDTNPIVSERSAFPTLHSRRERGAECRTCPKAIAENCPAVSQPWRSSSSRSRTR